MIYLKRIVSATDFEPYYMLKCQEDAVLWSGFMTKPDKDRLYNHFIHNIISDNRILIYYMYDSDNENPQEVIGYGQLTKTDSSGIEFSAANIFKKFQGCMYFQDLSKMIIDEAVKLGYTSIIGWASEKNKPAIINLRINKFKKTDEFEEREMKAFNEIHKFYKWIKEIK